MGTGIALFGMGMYAYLKDLNYDLSAFTWVPIVCLAAVVSISAAGMRNIPYVVAAELLPQNVRIFSSNFLQQNKFIKMVYLRFIFRRCVGPLLAI